jgi:spore maturation protein CgeB
VAREEELASEVLFVGNTRGQRRPAVEWAVEAGLPLVVYGEGWDGSIPPRFVRGSHFPNERLAHLYSSADVVLNDHWPDMREQGFISNRIFDAVASGAVVVSDRVAGLEGTFGDLVPTYSNAAELEDVIRSLLKDEERRSSISRAASALVLEEHTFSHRAERIIELLRPLLSGRAGDLDGATLSL